MYTNGTVIIEKNFFTIKVITVNTEVIYILRTEEETYELFINLILEIDRNKNLYNNS